MDVYQEPCPRVARGLGLAGEFRRRAHEVKLVYSLKPHTAPLEEAVHRQEHPFETLPTLRHAVTFAKKIRQVARLAEWADVILVQSTLPHTAMIAMAAGYMAGRPVHCDWDEWDSRKLQEITLRRATRWPLKVAERSLPRLCDSMSVASSELRERAISYGASPDRVVMAPSGVDLKQFSPIVDGAMAREAFDLHGNVVFFLGQPERGEEFLRICLAVRDDVPDLVAVLPGEPGSLENLRLQFNGSRRAIFTGPVERFGLQSLLACASACVGIYKDTAEDRARSPIEVLQAMAMGKPVVATAAGEVPGLIGEAGFQPLPDDFVGHVNAIERVFMDPKKARELGARGRVIAQDRGHWGIAASPILGALYRDLDERNMSRFFRGPPGAAVGPPQIPPQLKHDAMQDSSRLARDTNLTRMARFVDSNLDLVGVLNGKTSFKGPRMIQLDPTNACNNDCIACWSFSPLLSDKSMPHEERGKHIPLDRLFPLVDELAEMGTEEVYLAGGGDPWMYPHMVELLARIKERGMRVTIHTNFSMVDRAKAKRIVELGVDFLTVSLWAATAETYTRNHPNKAEETFERVVDTLTYLCSLRQSRSAPFVKLYNVISKLNVHEFPLMHQFARKIGADGIEFAPVDTIPDRTECLLLDEEDRRWLQDRCLEMEQENSAAGGRPQLFDFDIFKGRIGSQETVLGLHDEKNVSVTPCTIGFHFARIMADGNVTPCMKGDKIPLGNIYQNSFREIWSGSRHNWFREKARQIPRSDPFFALIGKDPSARVGCYKSCDDIGRNKYIQNRLKRLTFTERWLLQAAGPVLKMQGRAL